VRKLVKPVNAPKGVSRETVKDYVLTDDSHEDAVSPDHRDLQPKDVFQPLPRFMNVLDLARTGWPGISKDYQDMEEAISDEIPLDKGWDTVKNLNQYLVKTDGGGGTKPVGGRK
jgi:hypothetical protein